MANSNCISNRWDLTDFDCKTNCDTESKNCCLEHITDPNEDGFCTKPYCVSTKNISGLDKWCKLSWEQCQFGVTNGFCKYSPPPAGHTTPAPSTAAPTTPASTTPASTTPASTTPASTTPASTTPASTTPASTTPASTTPASTTPASTTPASTTPASTTPASTTPASTLPAVCSACTNITPCLMANGTCWAGSKEQCDDLPGTWCGDSGGGGGGGTVTTCAPGQVLNNNKCETEVFDWKIQSCPPCGDSVTLSASCQNQLGKTVDDKKCTKAKPSDVTCPQLDPCTYRPIPDKMLGMYYYVGDCPEQARNVPSGLKNSANTIFVSFIDGGTFDEDQLPCGVKDAAQTIKAMNPNMPVMYSIGGQAGSESQLLYDYLKNTPTDTIVNHILSWEYADGIDWDLEPPSGGVAKMYGHDGMPEKIVSISTKVKQTGMNVTMAGFGTWIWDADMGPLFNAMINAKLEDNTPVFSKFGVMAYPIAEYSATKVSGWFDTQWATGCQIDSCNPKSQGVEKSLLAGGISGNSAVDDAINIADTYVSNGVNSVIVWMVKPENKPASCLDGWWADNSKLSDWLKVLNILGGSVPQGKSSTIPTGDITCGSGPGPDPGPPVPGPTGSSGLPIGWDYAYFFSGIGDTAFNENDMGQDNSPCSPLGSDRERSDTCNVINADGGDSSCMYNPDSTGVFPYCKNNPYGNAFINESNSSGLNECIYDDGRINLVNPDEDGKVLVHSGRTFGQDPIHAGFKNYCSTSKYSPNKSQSQYKTDLENIETIYRNCGAGDTILWNGGPNRLDVGACLIKKSAFGKVGISLPEEDGRPATSYGGIALSFGHGLSKGACGSVTMQQNAPGVSDDIKGNTRINYQIGTRSFSGEVTDSFNMVNNKLDSSTAYFLIESGDPKSNTCSQPVFKEVDENKFSHLLQNVVNSINGPPSGGDIPCTNATYGFDCNIPDPNTIQVGDINTNAPIYQKYANANAEDERVVSWDDMALAWKAAGNNMDYCEHALIIGGGECQGDDESSNGCKISGTGASGIWQNDWARDNDNYNLYNPVSNASASKNKIVVDPSEYGVGCYYNTGTKNAPRMYKGAPPDGGVGGGDKDYWDTSGCEDGNCNWFGPYCHWQIGGAGTTCCAWTGGGNPDQPQGFPYYYMQQFLDYHGDSVTPECKKDPDTGEITNCTPEHMREIATKAMSIAKTHCDIARSDTENTPNPFSVTPSHIPWPPSGGGGGDSGGGDSGGKCSGDYCSPDPDGTDRCRSQSGYCGSSPDYCNSNSTWTKECPKKSIPCTASWSECKDNKQQVTGTFWPDTLPEWSERADECNYKIGDTRSCTPAIACPSWTMSDNPDDYSYNPDDWGGNAKSGGADAPLMVVGQGDIKTGGKTTSCLWINKCKKITGTCKDLDGTTDIPCKDLCMKQCPIILGIAYNESKFNPNAQSYDGIGRGLFQVGGGSVNAECRGFTGDQCKGEAGGPAMGGGVDNARASDTMGNGEYCTAYNPNYNMDWALKYSSYGSNWLPAGASWWSCDSNTKTLRALEEDGGDFQINDAVHMCQQALSEQGENDISYDLNDSNLINGECAVGTQLFNGMKFEPCGENNCPPGMTTEVWNQKGDCLFQSPLSKDDTSICYKPQTDTDCEWCFPPYGNPESCTINPSSGGGTGGGGTGGGGTGGGGTGGGGTGGGGTGGGECVGDWMAANSQCGSAMFQCPSDPSKFSCPGGGRD